MKPTNYFSLLTIGFSLAATAPLVFAETPSEKTTPERKMTTHDHEKGKDSAAATVDQNRAKLESNEGKGAGVIVGAEVVKTAGTLADVIEKSVTFSTLTKALAAADLTKTFSDPGAYTVFAPTDAAFDKLPAGALGKLLLPENKEKLRSLLLYHVVAGNVMAKDLKNGEVKTMNGESVKIDVDKEEVKVNDAKVFSADVPASNGVVHSIGTVLVPKSMKDFADLDK
jgi:uncharacterized surface protein with fasciclin (FAS1) repeats